MTPIEMLDAHSRIQTGCFLDGVETLGSGLKYAFSHRIQDTFWNYAYGIKADIKDLNGTLKEIREAAARHKRPPALYLTPNCEPAGLASFVAHDGVVDDVWMSVTGVRKFDTSSSRLNVMRIYTSDQLNSFVAVFRDAYGPADGASEVGYTGLPEEYPQTLLNCKPTPPVSIVHFIGKSGSEPVAIASIHMAPPVAGLYNVGIRHKFRRKGLGTEVSRVALNFALDNGCNTIFLQTQPDSPVESLYSKVGFSRTFLGRIVSISL